MAGGVPILHYVNREPLALWRDQIAVAARACVPEPLTGAVMLQLVITKARPPGHYRRNGELLPRFADAWPASRPDVDKLARAVLDALTGVLYRDDGQVVTLDVTKRYGEQDGMTVYAAVPVPGQEL
jgi:Holliday junction resolvase RusA-like endonuclease